MKKSFKIISIIIILLIVTATSGLYYLSRGLNEGETLALSGINPSSIDDGVYIGTYESGRWVNQLEVQVGNGRITQIQVITDVKFVQEGVSDTLFEKVISAQDTKVDTVSGATVTSKAYLKAIENALKQ